MVDFSQRFAFFQLELLAVPSEWIAAVKGKLNMVLGMSGHSQWELEITTAVAENEKGQKKMGTERAIAQGGGGSGSSSGTSLPEDDVGI